MTEWLNRLNQDEKTVFGSSCASSCARGNNESMNSKIAKSTVTTDQDKPIFSIIDDTSPDPKQWVTFSDNTNDINFRLYEASKSNIYNSKVGWQILKSMLLTSFWKHNSHILMALMTQVSSKLIWWHLQYPNLKNCKHWHALDLSKYIGMPNGFC